MLIYQSDSNVVIYTIPGAIPPASSYPPASYAYTGSAVWSLNSQGKARGGWFVFQTDYNIVLYNAFGAGHSVWSSDTNTVGCDDTCYLQLEDNCECLLIQGSTGTTIWHLNGHTC